MNLIDEITEAYAALQAAETEATEASHRLRKCKLHRKKCDEELGRLIKELKTGESRYSLLERISRNGETATPGPGPWSEDDVDDAITHSSGTAVFEWRHLRDAGSDDRTILEVLRAIWPQTPYFYHAEDTTGAIPFTIRGGCDPAIWMGQSEMAGPPHLTGLALADRVRRVLGIPRAPEPIPDGQYGDGGPLARAEARAKARAKDEALEPNPKKPRRKRGV